MDTNQIEKIIERLLVPINSKLDALPTKTDIESSMKIFREKIARVDEKVERVRGEINDLAQYVRRLDLRIFGVPSSSFHDKTVEEWVLQYFNKDLRVSISGDAIERAHRIGKASGGKVQVIVRFSTWKNRCLVYHNRKKGNFPISVDLTQENQTFYKAVRALVAKHPEELAFSFVDINCRVGVKLQNGSLKFPTSVKDLVDMLS